MESRDYNSFQKPKQAIHHIDTLSNRSWSNQEHINLHSIFFASHHIKSRNIEKVVNWTGWINTFSRHDDCHTSTGPNEQSDGVEKGETVLTHFTAVRKFQL